MQSTNQAGAGRGAVIAGAVLMTIGAASLISQFFPDYDRYLPLGIGLVLVLVFAFTRNYLALIGWFRARGGYKPVVLGALGHGEPPASKPPQRTASVRP